MKTKFYTLLLLLFIKFGIAQQWINKAYTYDSLPNIVYGNATNFNGGAEQLKMDVYLPKCDNTSLNNRKPLMLVIHGGSFLAGTRYDPNISKITKDFAKRGYVTATIEYRLGFVSDDQTWNCNLVNYPCVFATDTTEWFRSWYRGVQDAKGALRYLINNHATYGIDTSNVFVVGESAGAFLAMGVGFLDTISERPLQTYSIVDAPTPAVNTFTCLYNAGKTFTTTIFRPDLGGIDGTIEPTTIKYKIKAVGSFYGGVVTNLFQHTKYGATAPALYLYHQPCDLVVPFNVGRVNAGSSWCLASCYNCYGYANTPLVSGGNAIKNMITNNSLPINLQSEFTSNLNPNNCLFGSWSCADQLNNPCHEIDNYTLRTNNMATFFASKITTTSICNPLITSIDGVEFKKSITVYPNPFQNSFIVNNYSQKIIRFTIENIIGENIKSGFLNEGENTILFNEQISKGVYFIKTSTQTETSVLRAIAQ